MSLTKWTYLLGDGKAIGGHELTLIARKVYESMMKTRADSTILSHSVADFDTFRNDMSDFNHKITTWGESWRSAFSTCTSGHCNLS
jgi:putative NADH-flavin reductase